jgi:hypothetical protein
MENRKHVPFTGKSGLSRSGTRIAKAGAPYKSGVVADRRLEGVDKINNVAVACYLDVEGACHGNERSTRRH